MFTYKTRVAASQIGSSGAQSLTSIIASMQDCSQFWLETEPVLAQHLDENNLTMIIASRQVDIMRYPAYGEELDIVTGIYESNRYLGYRNTALVDQEGAPLVQGWEVGAFIDKTSGKASSLSKEVLGSIIRDEPFDMEYLSKRIDTPDAEPVAYPGFLPKRSDIDFNQHVNNVQYIRMAQEYTPATASYSRVRVEYRTQSKLGDKLTPVVYDGADGLVCVQLLQADERPSAIVEFSFR